MFSPQCQIGPPRQIGIPSQIGAPSPDWAPRQIGNIPTACQIGGRARLDLYWQIAVRQIPARLGTRPDRQRLPDWTRQITAR